MHQETAYQAPKINKATHIFSMPIYARCWQFAPPYSEKEVLQIQEPMDTIGVLPFSTSFSVLSAAGYRSGTTHLPTSTSRTGKVCQNLRPTLTRYFRTSIFNCDKPRPNSLLKNGAAKRLHYSNEIERKKPPSATNEQEPKKEDYTNGDSVKKSTFSVAKFDMVRLVHSGKNTTPKGLFMLSNLDQIVPYPVELLFAFQTNSSYKKDVGEVLKQSLSKVLEVYYPLAGRLKVGFDGKIVVDCDGGSEGGVPFGESFCDEAMAVAVGDVTMIEPELAEKLVYSNPRPYETILDVPPLAIQVTRFRCGGIILGVRLNHVIFDGRGIADFMSSWSEIARGLPLSIHPHLDSSILSPRKPPKIQFSHPQYSKVERTLTPLLTSKEIIVTKSLCFTPAMLSQLRKLAVRNNNNNNNNENEPVSPVPTTFELISALAWICWTKTKKVSPEKTSQIITGVDARYRLQPPMPKRYFGNCIVLSCAQSRARELTSQPFSYTVGIVHDAIKAVTDDYIRSTIDFHEVTRKPIELDNTLVITKLTRLPFYEIDFGWGVASQVALGRAFENVVAVLSQEKDSKNLVISATLPAEAMETFQELIKSQLNDD